MIAGRCLVCGGKLIDHVNSIEVRCEKCNKITRTNIVCENNHYLCDRCAHEEVLSKINKMVPTMTSANPIDIGEELMMKCGISGNSPHVIVTAAFLTAIKNLNGSVTDDEVLEGIFRATQIPGGWCGYYGACGAGIALGTAFSIIKKATPMSDKERSFANEVTSGALNCVAELGGPRCCASSVRRVLSYGVVIAKEELGIEFPNAESDLTDCWTRKFNPDCKGIKCIYNPIHKTDKNLEMA